MTDPIRAALEKAWHESPSFLVDLPQGRVRQSLSLEEFAKGIHDFLCALPAGYVEVPSRHGGNRQLGMNHLHAGLLADAVLAAAKEDRE
jgi:hypothetical protein